MEPSSLSSSADGITPVSVYWRAAISPKIANTRILFEPRSAPLQVRWWLKVRRRLPENLDSRLAAVFLRRDELVGIAVGSGVADCDAVHIFVDFVTGHRGGDAVGLFLSGGCNGKFTGLGGDDCCLLAVFKFCILVWY